jgi:hypothetical protein
MRHLTQKSMAKHQKKIFPVALTVIMIIVAGFGLYLATKNKTPLPEPTEILGYSPVPDASLEYQVFDGKCQLGSIYSFRGDIYTCDTESVLFDVCFKLEKDNLFFCGSDPLSKETGVIVRSIEQTAALDMQERGKNVYLVLALFDGTACTPMGNINLDIDGKTALYQCTNLNAVFEEPMPQPGGRWSVAVSEMEENPQDHSWRIKSVKEQYIKTIWK